MQHNRSMPDVSVVPVLVYDDVTEAREWLCRVFSFTERWHIGDHRAQLSFGTGAVVVRDNSGDDGPPARCSIMVRVDDVVAHCEHARSLGATIAEPPTDHKYGGGSIPSTTQAVIAGCSVRRSATLPRRNGAQFRTCSNRKPSNAPLNE